MLKKIIKTTIVCSCFIFIALVTKAQPGSLSTNNLSGAGIYNCTNLTDKGSFRQVRIQAGVSSSSVTWEFPLDCSLPGDIWRPTSAGTSAVAFNSIMNPSSSTNSARYNTSNGGNAGTFATTTNGNYYTVNIEENSAADNYFQVLETSFNPTSLGSPTVNFTGGKGNYGATNVSFTLPSALNGSENLYCRYSTNSFSTSTLIQCTVSGTSVDFVIPAQAANASVAFYFYTSTKSLSSLNSEASTNGQRAHDMNTLELLNNGGSNYTYSQPNNNVLVNSTGGTTTPTGYSTLGGALNAISAGTHTGVITIGVFANTSESGTTVFPVSGTGSASFSYIGIQPAGGGARTVSANVAGTCFQYGGSSNITINGLNTGGNSITFENTSTGNVNTFQLSNDAVNDSFLNMTIKGSTTASSGGVVALYSAGTGNGNDNNVFSGVTFKPSGSNLPVVYIYSSGSTTAGKENSGNIVDNCVFEDFYCASSTDGGGLNINLGNTGWTITNNHFYWTSNKPGLASRTVTAIFMSNTGVGFNITGNYIGGSGIFCSGSPLAISGTIVTSRFRGMYISIGSGTNSTIASNKINNIKWYTTSGATTTPGVFSGIHVAGGNLTIGGILGQGNIIGSTSGTDSIILGSTNNGVLYTGIAVDASGSGSVNTSILNNQFGAISWGGITASIATSVSNAGSFTAINITGGTTTHTIDSNTVGNSTTNNIKFTVACTSSVACAYKGIVNSSSANTTVSNNIVQNHVNAYVPSSANSTFIFRGIEVSAGTNTVTKNTIRNITTAGNFTGNTSTAYGMTGILLSAGTNNQSASQNVIHSMSNTHATSLTYVIGMSINSTGTGLVFDRNIVHSLSVSSSSTSSVIAGISFVSGTLSASNNIVRLGINAAGGSISNDPIILGMDCGSSTTPTIYHNSIYIGGTVTTSSSICFAFRTITSNVRIIQNNIFYNNRTRSAGTGIYCAFSNTGGTVSSMNINGNIYKVNAIGGVLLRHLSNDFSTIRLWREFLAANNATGLDTNSAEADPLFVAPDAAAGSFSLKIQNGSQAESRGLSISAVTSDFEGDTRSSNTPNDIGADAGTYTANTTDIWQPNMTFTNLGYTASLSNRTLSVNITDQGNGVYLDTTNNSPRIWWRRTSPSVGTWVHDAGTLASGTKNNGIWNFTIDYTGNGYTATAGDSIEYIIVAQDTITNNVWFSAAWGTAFTNVRTMTTAPVAYTAYKIIEGFSGNYNVGTGQTYTTLTDAGSAGFFNAVNNGILVGNVTVTIVSDITESGTIGLNQWIETGTGNYTMTVISDGTLRTISASNITSNPMININGADRVKFYGGSSKLLKFRNTNTTSGSTTQVFRFVNTATNDTLSNLEIESNSTRITSAAIDILPSTTNNNSIKIDSCYFHEATGGTTGLMGIAIYSNHNTNSVDISNNMFLNVGRGTSTGVIHLTQVASGARVTNNSIYRNTAATSAGYVGISIGTGDNHIISNNHIGGSDSLCGGSASAFTNGDASFIGIQITNGVSTTNPIYIFNNTIKNIALGSTNGSQTFIGIEVDGGKVQVGNTFGNGNTIGDLATANSITLVGGTSAQTPKFYGIYSTITSATSSSSICNNTIANGIIGGTATGGAIYGIYYIVNSGSSATDTIYNNTIKELAHNGQNATTNGSALVGGIQLGTTFRTYLVDNNTIRGIRSTTTASVNTQVNGIMLSASGASILLSRNKIYDLTNTSTGSGTINGINFFNATVSTITNNQISITNGSNTNAITISGIVDNVGSVCTNNYYFNSIYIGGSASSGALTSRAFSKISSTVIKFNGNLIFNERSGGSGVHHAFFASNTASFTSNYNLLVVADTSKIGSWASVIKNFSGWKSSSAGDANSWCALNSTVIADSLFNNKSIGDLSIKTDNSAAWYVNGKGLAGVTSGNVPIDFQGDTKSTTYGYGTDIGADEFTPTSLPPLCTQTGSIANNDSVTYTFAGRTIARVKWYGSSLPSSLNVRYYSGTNPPDSTNNGNNVGANYMNFYTQMNATGGSGYLYDATIYYDEALLGNIPSESAMEMAKAPDAGVGAWKVHASSEINTTLNYMRMAGLNSFSSFGASNFSAPLPVGLLSFTATPKNTDALITWQTATEQNCSHFNVLRSINNSDFEKIATINAKGNSLSLTDYIYTDENIAEISEGKPVHYRIEMVDLDGSSDMSEIQTIYFKNNINISSIYPQPATDQLSINLDILSESSINICLIDLNGKVVVNNIQNCGKGNSVIHINTQSLSQGIYILKIENGDDIVVSKIFKK